MRLAAEEKHCLEELYLHHGIATDQLRRVPVVINSITAAFNRMTGRDFDAATLHRYMVNRRKNKDWPCLGTRARKFPSVLSDFTHDELAILESLYVDFNKTSDELLFSPKTAKTLADLFAKKAGRIVPGHMVVAAIFQKRKRGVWACIREGKEAVTEAAPFSDIQIVAKKFKQA
jgi:hypothetical protein